MRLRFRGVSSLWTDTERIVADSEKSSRHVSVYVSVAPVELQKPVLQKQLEMEPTVRIGPIFGKNVTRGHGKLN